MTARTGTLGGMGHQELFPLDRGLVTRMAVVGSLTPLLVLGALLAVVLLAPWKLVLGVGIALAMGVFAAVK